MTYVVITPEGERLDRNWPATAAQFRAELVELGGRPGLVESVPLDHASMRGLLARPDPTSRRPVNVLGSCLLRALGAPPLPCFGKIAITGWLDAGDDSRLLDLGTPDRLVVDDMLREVRDALAGGTGMHPQWARNIRAHAAFARQVHQPPARFTPGQMSGRWPDWFAHRPNPTR